MEEEEGQTTVHGVMVEETPIRTSRKNPAIKYFSGKKSDGKKSPQVIHFNQKLRPLMEKSLEEKKSVALVNCKVKTGKFTLSLEMMTSQAEWRIHHSGVAKPRHTRACARVKLARARV